MRDYTDETVGKVDIGRLIQYLYIYQKNHIAQLEIHTVLELFQIRILNKQSVSNQF